MPNIGIMLRVCRIKEFGYVPHKLQKVTDGEGDRKLTDEELASFGNVEETLRDMQAWLAKHPILGSTTTNETDRGERIFGSTITNHGDSWCLTLVEEVAQGVGGAQVFNLSAHPEKPEVLRHRVDPNKELLGIQAHYWFVPKENLCASIRIGTADWPNFGRMEAYVRGFMARYATRAVQDLDGNIVVTAPCGLNLRCKSRFVREREHDREAEQAVLSGKVQRILLKETVNTYLPEREPDKAKWYDFGPTFASVFGTGSVPVNGEAPVVLDEDLTRVEIKILRAPTRAQVQQLIAGWQGGEDGWANLGFSVKRTGGAPAEDIWLANRRKVVRQNIDVPIDAANGIIDPVALVQQLEARRASIVLSLGA